MSQPQTISIGSYICERLAQLGSTEIFGVPGDFNLAWIDLVEDHPKLQWVGNVNELNATYAADGYARVKRTIACVATTQGVGELSGINGIAGAMSEHIPIVSLVGVANTSAQASHALLHHTLGDGRFSAFYQMAQQVTAATAYLTHKDDSAGADIDRVLTVALTKCQPVYIALPTDLINAQISAERLKTPLPPPGSARPSSDPIPNPTSDVEQVLNDITEMFLRAHDPVILVDGSAVRFGVEGLVQELADATGIRYYTTPMGKGAMNERSPLFGGTYIGGISVPEVKNLIESSDMIIWVGKLSSDFNSGGFTQVFHVNTAVELHSDRARIGYAMFPGVNFKIVLPLLTQRLSAIVKEKNIAKPVQEKQPQVEQAHAARKEFDTDSLHKKQEETASDGAIKHAWFWPRVGKFLRENDVIVTETGTSNFGILDIALPKGANVISQILWGSIGWAGGSIVGAAFGGRDLQRRTLLFTGDGSWLLSVQEIITLIRHDLKPILFVLNNDGYEIERKIHGPERAYNDIGHIDWPGLFKVFSPPEWSKQRKPRYRAHTVRTPQELDSLLNDEEFARAECLTLVEVFMPRGDAPRSLIMQGEMSAKVNA